MNPVPHARESKRLTFMPGILENMPLFNGCQARTRDAPRKEALCRNPIICIGMHISKDVYLHTHIHIYTSIYIYMYICMKTRSVSEKVVRSLVKTVDPFGLAYFFQTPKGSRCHCRDRVLFWETPMLRVCVSAASFLHTRPQANRTPDSTRVRTRRGPCAARH